MTCTNIAQCHRTWEALAAGAVPLVQYDEMNTWLYEELPVIQVKDWSKITTEWLEEKWEHMQSNKASYDMRKLYTPYWLSQLASPGDRKADA